MAHTGERQYKCGKCGVFYSRKDTLNRHARTHTGIRSHKCQFCGKEFFASGGLKAHLFHHTGENGFSCKYCRKCFNRKALLQRHIQYKHEKVKPHTCKDCNKSFVRKEDLDRHAIVHTGIKTFQCPVCNKNFGLKTILTVHLRTHTTEEPKFCSVCGRTFIREDCLLRHMRKQHREKLEALILKVEKKTVPALNSDMFIFCQLPTKSLADSIEQLLKLLVDETTLKAFGWPEKRIDELLEAVIHLCGEEPVNPTGYSYLDRLRENCKLLFTVVINDKAVKTLLNYHSVDDVILHVLRLTNA